MSNNNERGEESTSSLAAVAVPKQLYWIRKGQIVAAEAMNEVDEATKTDHLLDHEICFFSDSDLINSAESFKRSDSIKSSNSSVLFQYLRQQQQFMPVSLKAQEQNSYGEFKRDDTIYEVNDMLRGGALFTNDAAVRPYGYNRYI